MPLRPRTAVWHPPALRYGAARAQRDTALGVERSGAPAWPFYQPDEMALIASLRRSHGELRWLIDAPGHVFGADERNELIGWIYLMECFGWDAYLFASPYHGKMLQIFDEDFIRIISSQSDHFGEAREIARANELKTRGGAPVA